MLLNIYISNEAENYSNFGHSFSYYNEIKDNPKYKLHHFDEYFTRKNEDELYQCLFEELIKLLEKVGGDFSRLGSVRVVITGNELEQSVTFKMTNEAKLGVFKNWANGNNITHKMWGVWSKLNECLLKEVA